VTPSRVRPPTLRVWLGGAESVRKHVHGGRRIVCASVNGRNSQANHGHGVNRFRVFLARLEIVG
jgi:hypothetical protein